MAYIELYEMIRVSYIIARPIVFILFYDRGWQGEVFKIMKIDHFLVFLAVLVFFPKFLEKLRSSFY